MSRRRQTTGLPVSAKRKDNQQAEQSSSMLDRLLGNPRTRAEREERINRLLTRSMLVIGALVAMLVGIALFVSLVVIPNQAVASVNNEAITVREFQERVRFERARLVQELNSTIAQLQSLGFREEDVNQFLRQDPYATWINEVNFPDQLGQRVLNDIIDDRLIALQAAELGLTADQESVQSSIDDYFNYDPTAVAAIGLEPTETPIPTETPTPFVSPTPTNTPVPTSTPTPLPEDVEVTPEVTDEAPLELPTIAPSPTPSADDVRARYEESVLAFRTTIRTQASIGDDAIDQFFQRRALRDAVTEYLAGEEPTAVFADVRHILVETEDAALEIIAALNAGESFAELARAVSIDTGSGSRGGELGKQPITQYVTEFADAIRDAEIGAIVGPVQSQFGYHILQVRERTEEPVSGAELTQARTRSFNEWLDTIRTENQDIIEIFDNWPDYVPGS